MMDRKRNERRLARRNALQTTELDVPSHSPKVSYYEILRTIKHYSNFLETYRSRVLTQKTRTIRLLGRKNPSRIIHSLLGFEVQASYKRIQCPDLVTARYLKLFSELGCHSIKLPYDPTLTAQIIPEFEIVLDTITAKIQELFPQDLPLQRRVTRRIYAIIRRQLRAS
jgi:hypothetical protein